MIIILHRLILILTIQSDWNSMTCFMLLSTRFITRLNIEIQGIEHCTKKRSKNSVTKNMSFSTTTLIGKSQGGDFVFEAKVKQQ